MVLGAATVVTGLVGGVWFGFACGVMPALGRTGDRTFIEVMQYINSVIENPVFFAGFFGALVLTAVGAFLTRRQVRAPGGRWMLGALVLAVLVLVVTSAANVPLNNALAAAGDPAGIADPRAVREAFEGPWVFWNIVRAVLNAAGLFCLWQVTRLRAAAPASASSLPDPRRARSADPRRSAPSL